MVHQGSPKSFPPNVTTLVTLECVERWKIKYFINIYLMDYVLRLQALDGYRDKFDNVFGDRFSRVLCVHHTGRKGDNPHYHFALTCDYRKDALRKYLKKEFSLSTGNRHLSLKNWDGDRKACSYMFHEGTEALIRKGFSDDELKDFKDINAGIQEVIKKNAPSTIVQEAIVYFSSKPDKAGEYVVFKWIMDKLRQNGDWVPNKFQMERWIMRVQAGVLDKKDWDRWCEYKFKEWFA